MAYFKIIEVANSEKGMGRCGKITRYSASKVLKIYDRVINDKLQTVSRNRKKNIGYR